MKVPAPTWCPECRLVRRMVWRNERALYKRPCSLCGVEKIMMFPKDSPYTVYCVDCWWSDTWEASSFAKEYDFSRAFFEQFKELYLKVPRPGIIQQQNVRSEYTNRTSMNKECYLIYGSNKNEHCMYGTQINDSKESLDCFNLQESELCYECIDCFKSYKLLHSKDCMSCSDSYFLLDCRNCQNCFGCTNLRNKNYCIFNVQYTKKEYERKVAALRIESFSEKLNLTEKFNAMKQGALYPYMIARQHINSTGNWLDSVRDVKNSYGCRSVEEGKNCFSVIDAKDVMDYTYWGRSCELIYETISVGLQCSNIKFCNELWSGVTNAEYSMNCPSSHDIFGCVGLRKKEYSILNKQYAPEDFEKLTAEIRSQMNTLPYRDAKGRVYTYGEFFPPELSPFSYNETMAQEYFPLSKEEIIASGFTYKEQEKKQYGVSMKCANIPDSISLVNENILKEIIECEHEGVCSDQCSSAFRITSGELEFCKKLDIPLPRLCPNCRHFARLKERNPLHLWNRSCACEKTTAYTNTVTHVHSKDSCPHRFETTFSPNRSETVYCEACYQVEVS